MNDPITDRAALESLAHAVQRAPASISLVLHRTEVATDFQDRLEAVLQQIEKATQGAVEVRNADGQRPSYLPALTIRAAGRDVIHYMAVPEGPEEAPFLEVLSALAGVAAGDRLEFRLGQLEEAAEVLVFVAPGCPNCPHGVRAAATLAVASPLVTVSVVDATQFAAQASQFQVKSVPTAVVDGELTLVGVDSIKQLPGRLLERQAGGPGAELAVFTSLVESGRLADAALRLANGSAIEAFAELWSRSSLESRIGLTLTAQHALDEDPTALDGLVPHLLPNLEHEDPARRSDTADLLGSIGHQDARAALKTLCQDEHPDVAEAAQDALDALDERGV
jgi:hypothetical protein